MTQEEFAYLLQQLAVEFPVKADDIMLVGMKDMEGRIKKRVFNDHRDSANTSLGRYTSKSWKSQRKKKGLQIRVVDLQYSGEMKNSLTTIQDGNDSYLYFNEDKQFGKAEGQEKINGRKKGKGTAEIWTPTDDEDKKVEEYILEITDIEVNKILDKFV